MNIGFGGRGGGREGGGEGRGGGGGGKFNIVRDYPPGKLARINFLTL